MNNTRRPGPVPSAQEYIALLKTSFDFPRLKSLMARPDFSFVFDGMHGVAGAYASRVFVDELGAPEDCLLRRENYCMRRATPARLLTLLLFFCLVHFAPYRRGSGRLVRRDSFFRVLL